MITQMVIRELYERDGEPHNKICVDAEYIGLETSDISLYFNAACEYIEHYYDLDTGIAKIDIFYSPTCSV